MRRIKNWIEYYTIPGWWVENWETEKSAAIREIKEETDLDIELDDPFCELIDKYHNWIYYLTKTFTGIPKVSWPEAARININNQYYLERIEKENIWNIPLLPEEIKQKIIGYFQHY